MAIRPELLPALAAFEAAARHQNFAHAGEELHLTASAVSHHVRKLEARLGVVLFQRHARGVTLTAEGRRLADAAGSALADVDDALRDLRDTRDEQDRVRISTLHSFAYTWLMPRLGQFIAAHPTVRLSVDTEVSLTRFEDGGPDLAIRHGPGHWPGLTAHYLMDEALFPVAAPDFPGIERVRTAEDIAALPLVADLSRQGWHDWFRLAGVHGLAGQFAHQQQRLLAEARLADQVEIGARHLSRPGRSATATAGRPGGRWPCPCGRRRWRRRRCPGGPSGGLR